MEGGHLLGQGSYGCAFTPPLLCKSRRTMKYKSVGKITEASDAEHEIRIANLLRKAPLVKNYLLLPEPESCQPAPIRQQKEKEIKDCEAISRPNIYKIPWNQSRQVFMPFGGKKPIGNMIMDSTIHPKYFDFFGFMKHILEAGSLLLTSGVCHYDLHPNNFIQDNYGVVRILDFGQAFDARKIDNEIIRTRWKQLYFGSEKDAPNPMVTNSEAPEITVLNAMRNGHDITSSVSNVLEGKVIFRDIEKILGVPRQFMFNNFKRFFDTSISVEKQEYIEFFKLYWTGFDAWAIGSLILTILKYQMVWTEFLQGEWKTKQGLVLLALKGLLNPNPRKRFDCVEALFIFDPTNNWIQQFGKPWLEKRHTMRERQQKIE
jgi:serine/threonine protein kinase